MKADYTSKTVYVTPKLLEKLQKGQDKFNFSKRVNDLVQLGLQAEQMMGILNKPVKLDGKNAIFADELAQYIDLGMKVKEGDFEGTTTLRSSIKYLINMYNNENPNNPL